MQLWATIETYIVPTIVTMNPKVKGSLCEKTQEQEQEWRFIQVPKDTKLKLVKELLLIYHSLGLLETNSSRNSNMPEWMFPAEITTNSAASNYNIVARIIHIPWYCTHIQGRILSFCKQNSNLIIISVTLLFIPWSPFNWIENLSHLRHATELKHEWFKSN